jgi:hypothetical protein
VVQNPSDLVNRRVAGLMPAPNALLVLSHADLAELKQRLGGYRSLSEFPKVLITGFIK